jgi:hypothetical protein
MAGYPSSDITVLNVYRKGQKHREPGIILEDLPDSVIGG